MWSAVVVDYSCSGVWWFRCWLAVVMVNADGVHDGEVSCGALVGDRKSVV